MKIIKNGETILELPDEPRNFDGGRTGKTVVLTHGDEEVKLATYATIERASEIARQLCRAYIDEASEFVLPEE